MYPILGSVRRKIAVAPLKCYEITQKHNLQVRAHFRGDRTQRQGGKHIDFFLFTMTKNCWAKTRNYLLCATPEKKWPLTKLHFILTPSTCCVPNTNHSLVGSGDGKEKQSKQGLHIRSRYTMCTYWSVNRPNMEMSLRFVEKCQIYNEFLDDENKWGFLILPLKWTPELLGPELSGTPNGTKKIPIRMKPEGSGAGFFQMSPETKIALLLYSCQIDNAFG